MRFRDMAERLWWTLLAAFLGALGVGDLLDISTIDAAITATAAAGVNFLLLVARARLDVLPEPGAGLPGLPTNDTVNVEERLLPYDSEPTTGAIHVSDGDAAAGAVRRTLDDGGLL